MRRPHKLADELTGAAKVPATTFPLTQARPQAIIGNRPAIDLES